MGEAVDKPGRRIVRVSGAARRMPPGMRSWPAVDPANGPVDAWFGAGRLVRPGDAVTAGVHAADDVLEPARRMSARARELYAQDGEDVDEAMSLRTHAAELKRGAGKPAEAFEDYEALARHYLAAMAPKPAIAYMRKALHVSSLDADALVRVSGRLLAAEIYVGVRRPGQATHMARKAEEFALGAGLADLALRADAISAAAAATEPLPRGRCACEAETDFSDCCGIADVPPVEFSDEALAVVDRRTPGPFRRGGWTALETLMRPAVGTERLTWYAWRVKDGCHSLVAYPNWSGRALRAATEMAEVARSRNSAEAASSAVLQAYVALESFLTAWKSLSRLGGGFPSPMVEKTALDTTGAKEKSRLPGHWRQFAKANFGDAWQPPDRKAFDELAAIRHHICHGAATAETVVPVTTRHATSVAYFESLGHEVGKAPAPWIDRIMTPALATWAVDVAKSQIAAVRQAWDARDREAANLEWLLGVDQGEEFDDAYPMDEEAGPVTPLATEWMANPGPAASGLRKFAVHGSHRDMVPTEEIDSDFEP